MRGFALAGGVALATAVGCGSAAPVPEVTTHTSSAIQGGTTDTTHDFAVGIVITLSETEMAVCSGALLAPNLVATARHCADQVSASTVDCSTTTFGAAYAPSQYTVTNSPSFATGSTSYSVAKIVTPTASDEDTLCGNDIALLILSENIQLPQYVEPVLNPPMTDHSAWATTVTAIGYGIDTPTDTNGTSAGTRRILEDIGLVCIPNDPDFVDCYSDPQARSIVAPTEFESGDGTCEGDSGSSAFDQTQFDAGKWVSFGVVSRGSVSTDGKTCLASIYTRFDAFSQLLIDTANEAAQMGGYSPPAWTNGAAEISTDSGAGTQEDGTACTADGACQSQSCVSRDGGNYVCASACGASASCPSGSSCLGGYCFAQTTSGKSGCAIGPGSCDPGNLPPWRMAATGLSLAVLVVARRRRRVKERQLSGTGQGCGLKNAG